MGVTVKDRGYAALMRRLARAAKPTSVTVGIHSDKGGEVHDEASGVTVVDVGAFHEFGLGVPRRSFIADWVEQNQEHHRELITKAAQAVLAGTLTIDQATARLGARLEAECKRRLTQTPADWPPLDPRTVARKKSSKPLIDTGALRAAITHKVEKGG